MVNFHNTFGGFHAACTLYIGHIPLPPQKKDKVDPLLTCLWRAKRCAEWSHFHFSVFQIFHHKFWDRYRLSVHLKTLLSAVGWQSCQHQYGVKQEQLQFLQGNTHKKHVSKWHFYGHTDVPRHKQTDSLTQKVGQGLLITAYNQETYRVYRVSKGKPSLTRILF